MDDELKLQLRDEILRERTRAEIDRRIRAANEYMHVVSYNMALEEDQPNHIKKDDVAPLLKKYAQEHGLVYVETDLVSFDELRGSEDYAIGTAFNTVGRRVSVAEDVFSASQDLYQPGEAALMGNFDDTYSAFSYWKIEEHAGGPPTSLDDSKVREQVTQTWRKLQALPKARARAEELAQLVSASDKPMVELLADERVTGAEGSIYLTVQETGDFTWLTRPLVPPTSLQPTPQVTLSTVRGAEKAGERFLKTVFQQLQPGETGIAPAQDDTAVYVVRIKERHPATDSEWAQLRKQFIDSGNLSAYTGLRQRVMAEYSDSWVEQMLQRYNVRFQTDQPE